MHAILDMNGSHELGAHAALIVEEWYITTCAHMQWLDHRSSQGDLNCKEGYSPVAAKVQDVVLPAASLQQH